MSFPHGSLSSRTFDRESISEQSVSGTSGANLLSSGANEEWDHWGRLIRERDVVVLRHCSGGDIVAAVSEAARVRFEKVMEGDGAQAGGTVFEPVRFLIDNLPELFTELFSEEQKENRSFIESFGSFAQNIPRLSFFLLKKRLISVCSSGVCSKEQTTRFLEVLLSLKKEEPALKSLRREFSVRFEPSEVEVLERVLFLGDIPDRIHEFQGRNQTVVFFRFGEDTGVYTLGLDGEHVGKMSSATYCKDSFPYPQTMQPCSLFGSSGVRKVYYSAVHLSGGVKEDILEHFTIVQRQLAGCPEVFAPQLVGYAHHSEYALYSSIEGPPGVSVRTYLSHKKERERNKIVLETLLLIHRLQKEYDVYSTRMDPDTFLTDGDHVWIALNEHMYLKTTAKKLVHRHQKISPSLLGARASHGTVSFDESDITWGVGHYLIGMLYHQNAPFLQTGGGSVRSFPTPFSREFSHFFDGTHLISDVVPEKRAGDSTVRERCYELLIYICFHPRSGVSLQDVVRFWNLLHQCSDETLSSRLAKELQTPIREYTGSKAFPLFRLTLLQLVRVVELPEEDARPARPSIHVDTEEELCVLPAGASDAYYAQTDMDGLPSESELARTDGELRRHGFIDSPA